MQKRCLILSCLLLQAGCSGEVARSPSTVIFDDSAGVRMVTSTTPAWSASSGWKVGPEPALRIGEVVGAPPYIFSGVVGVRLFGDSLVVVADGGSLELRFFDLEGRFLRSVGGEGGGPGEFQSMEDLLGCYPDSVVVLDQSGGLTTFSLDGEFTRRSPVYSTPGGPRPPYRFSCGSDGLIIVNGSGSRGFPRPDGLFWNRSHVFIGRLPQGASVDLGEYPTSQHWGTQGVSRLHPFGRMTTFAVGGGEVYLGIAEGHEIRVYDSLGGLTRVIRWLGESLRVGAKEVQEYVEWAVQRVAAGAQPGMRRYLEEMEWPSTEPSYRDLFVDEAGNLWVLRFDSIGDSDQRWWVFDKAGMWLGQISLPHGFMLTDVTRNFVVGIETDELGVERATLYELRKTQ
jgi:hypothetical protein